MFYDRKQHLLTIETTGRAQQFYPVATPHCQFVPDLYNVFTLRDSFKSLHKIPPAINKITKSMAI
jgi:hypothetical protein